MYTRLMAQTFIFFFLVHVSLASTSTSFLQYNLWNGNDDKPSATCECGVENQISKLESLITDINGIKQELRCVSKCSKSLVFSGSTNEYANWVQPASTNSATGGGLDAMTACFWIKTHKTTREPTVLSYAVQQQTNELLILFRSSNLMFFIKNGISPGGSFSSQIGVRDGKWHHVCFTWKSCDGSVEVYKDGVSEAETTGLAAGQRIEPSGTWIIGQDQDRVGGGFQGKNAFDGSLTDVNVWDRVLDASEISTLASENCGFGMQGNYKAYKDFVPQGEVQVVMTSCCD